LQPDTLRQQNIRPLEGNSNLAEQNLGTLDLLPGATPDSSAATPKNRKKTTNKK
jgi:hypothetical protein